MSFAKRFKHLREEVKHWTQDEAADALGVSRSTIAGYESESKNRIPRQEMLQTIATTFNVTIDYLLGRDEESELDETESNKMNMLLADINELTMIQLLKKYGFEYEDILFTDDEARLAIEIIKAHRKINKG